MKYLYLQLQNLKMKNKTLFGKGIIACACVCVFVCVFMCGCIVFILNEIKKYKLAGEKWVRVCEFVRVCVLCVCETFISY